jgi:hypothetical protein
MGAINFDVGKRTVRIMAADSVSFWQFVNTIKANGDAQRSCDPNKQGFNHRFVQQFVNWLRHGVPRLFLADLYTRDQWPTRPSVGGAFWNLRLLARAAIQPGLSPSETEKIGKGVDTSPRPGKFRLNRGICKRRDGLMMDLQSSKYKQKRHDEDFQK